MSNDGQHDCTSQDAQDRIERGRQAVERARILNDEARRLKRLEREQYREDLLNSLEDLRDSIPWIYWSIIFGAMVVGMVCLWLLAMGLSSLADQINI